MAIKMIETEVLVVGGGGAGFRAAIGARQKGVKTLLVSKGPLAHCGATPMAGADFTLDGKSMSQIGGLPGDPNDSPEKVMNDIVTQGCFLNNQKLVEQYIRVAPQCLRELIEWGINIKTSDQRMIFTTGTGIMRALLKKARAIGVDFIEDVAILDLIVSEGILIGAIGLDIRTGELINIRAKAAVIATGGWHKAFWPNTGMRDLSGDGIVMAHRAGADLGNLEFITFCCNVIFQPPIWRGSIAAYILSLWAGGCLSNSLGEEFLNKYDPSVVKNATSSEWNKCFISFATMREVQAGKGLPNGGVNYSRGHIPWEKFGAIAEGLYPNWKYKGIDFSEWGRKLKDNEPIEVGPAVEYFDGGIVVNERLETNLSGLYAAGECTLGPFGANRVFSAITEMLVHGADAGANAGEFAKNMKIPEADESILANLQEKIEAPLHRPKGLKPAGVRRSVQEAAHKNLSPIRNKEELESFIGFLKSIRVNELANLATTSKSRIYNKEWLDALELENMCSLLEMAAQSALQRTESRGVHYREDFPHTDNDNWLQESIVKKTASGYEISKRPVTVGSMTPPQGVTPYLDFIAKMMKSHSDTGGKH